MSNNIKLISGLIVLLISIVPLLFLTLYVHPSTDDYGFAQSTNIWRDTWFIYQKMDNRLVGNFLTILFCNANDLLYHRVELAIFILLFFSSIYYLLNVLNRYFLHVNQGNVIILFSVFSLMYVGYNPGISEAFFWHPGIAVWASSIALFNVLVSFIIQYIHRKNHILYIFSGVLFFVMVSQNEIMLLLFFVVGIFLSYLYFNKSFTLYKREILITLLILLVGGSIMVFGPGNYVRLNYISNQQPVTLIHLISYNFLIVRKILFLRPILLFNFLLIPFYYIITKKISFTVSPIKLLLVSFFFLFVLFMPSLIAKTLYSFRIQNVVYYFMLVLVFMNFINFAVYLRVNNYLQFVNLKYYSLSIVSFFLVHTFMQKESAIRTIYSDLVTGKVNKYNLEMMERERLIVSSVQDTVYIKPIANKPKSIFIDDITTDPTDWRNTLYSDYFKKRSIVLKD